MAFFATINGFESGALHGLATDGASVSVVSGGRSGSYAAQVLKSTDQDQRIVLGDPNDTGARTAGKDAYALLRCFLKILEHPSQPNASALTAALISPAAAGNVNNGTHKYKVTFVTDDGETEGESAAGDESNTVTVVDSTVNGKIALTNIPLGGVTTTARKIYRTAAGGSTFKLLTTLTNNNDVAFTDNIADASLGGEVPAVSTATSYDGICGWNYGRFADASYVAMEVNSAGQFRVNVRGTLGDWSTRQLSLNAWHAVTVVLYIHNCKSALSSDDKCYGEVIVNGVSSERISVANIGTVGSFAFDVRFPFLGDAATDSTSHYLIDDCIALCDTGTNGCTIGGHAQDPPDTGGGSYSVVPTVELPSANQIVRVPITGQGQFADWSGGYTLVDEVPFVLSGTDHQTSAVDEDTTTYTHDTAYNLGLVDISAIRVIAGVKAGSAASHAFLWNGVEYPASVITSYTVAGSPFVVSYGDITNDDFNTAEYGFRNKTGASLSLAGITAEVLCVSYRGRIRKDSIHYNDELDDAPNTCEFIVDGEAPKNRYRVRIGVDASTKELAADIHSVPVAPGTIDANDLKFNGTIVSFALAVEGRPSQTAWKVSVIDSSWLLDARRPMGAWEDVSVTTIVQEIFATYAPHFTLDNLEDDLRTATVTFDLSMTFRECLTALAKLAGAHWYIDYTDDLHFNTEDTDDAPDDLVDGSATLLLDQFEYQKDQSQTRNRIYVIGAGFSTNTTVEAPVGAPENAALGMTPTTGGAIPPATTNGGIIYYAISFVAANGGETGNPGMTGVGLGANTAIQLSSIPISADPRVVGRKIYRSKSPESDGQKHRLFLVATINDNTTTDFLDDAQDGTEELPPFNSTALIFAQVDDVSAQAELRQIAAEEGDDWDEGIREFFVSDSSLTTVEQAQARGQAELDVYARELESARYGSLDPKSRSGKTVTIALTEPSISTSLKIQSVSVDHVAYSPHLSAIHHVTASSVKFTLDDLLRKVQLGTSGGGSGGGVGGVVAGGDPEGSTAETAERLATARLINGLSFDGSADVSGAFTSGSTGAGFTIALSVSTITGTLGVTHGGTGTTTQFTAGSVVFAGASGVYAQDNASLFWDDSNNFLGLGTATPGFPLHIVKDWASVSSTQIVGALDSYDDVSRFIFRRANGSPSSSTAALLDEQLGNLAFRGYHSGGAFATNSSAAILGVAEENFTSSAQGGRLVFFTIPVGSTSSAERMRIDGAGHVGIGVTSVTAMLHLKAGTTAAATAPLKFTSGTSLTSAEAGAIEFTTDDLFFTISTGPARKHVLLTDGTKLTSGRVPFATTNGRLTDDSDLTFATDTLTVTKLLAPTSISSPSIISSAAITFTPASGSGVTFVLATTGDFAVNTDQLYVDTSAGRVGIGTTAPAGEFHVVSEEGSPVFFDVYIAGSSQGATIRGRKARGTIVAPRRAKSGDTLIGVNAIGATAADDSTDAALSTTATGNFTFAAAEDFTSTAQGTIFALRTTPIGSATSAERMRMTDVGNLKIAGTANRATTEGTNKLSIFDGTAPVGTLANGCDLYSTSGELRVMDAAGNATLLSPHDRDGNWIHEEVNFKGRRLYVEMERLIKAIDVMLGGGYVRESWQEAS